MKILIAGLGSIGRRHLQNLAKLGLSDFHVLTSGRCPLPHDDLPLFRIDRELERALDKQPDAVFVCNPTALHLETALAAARRGCHIFLEKPVSHNLDGLDELEDVADDLGVKLQVGFQFRFHGVFQQIKQALEAGKIGRIISAHAHWGEYLPGWHPWEDYRQSYNARNDLGGGVLLTLCHPFDYLRWLVGEVDELHAVGGKLSNLEIETEDTALISLRFENGAIGSVYLDYASRPPKHSLQITGTDGRVEWDATCGDVKIYTEGGRSFEFIQPGRFLDRNEMFLDEVAHFLDCIKNDRQPFCSLEDGIRALELALDAKNMLEFDPIDSNKFLSSSNRIQKKFVYEK
jgi:predicted dehydrogenase